jgi:hypothetical protein
MIHAVGNRGSWFAKIDGEMLPCVHEHWKEGQRYSDPGCVPSEGKWPRFISAIENGKKVLLTRSRVTKAPSRKSGVSLAREGYLGVYAVSDVVADDQSLRFAFGNRIK